ncbi:S41 family peptidase [Actinoplanes sp. NPDC049548]|uniref:S41 family peptidase n=1 Tax=Actinoplanes sp. NPDC049548 TaxID=3155152 RepID=UPI0034144EA6
MGDDVIEKALGLLCDRYIFPAKAAEAATLIRAKRDAGAYDGLDETALGERLTEVLQGICADKHLRVRPRGEDVREALTEEQIVAAYEQQLRRNNHGIARVERLEGNVGYLDVRQIPDASVGGRAIAAAMELVSHTAALIVDLRKNRGGAPNGVIFWTSYFFPDDQTHLNDIYDGESGRTRQFWSLAHLPGERYLDRPVYLLTSDVTFSAGEELCYNLQAQGRATLVGATTRGGAHPTEYFPLSPTMEITVPVARSVNPVTGTNWEGTGVVPDVEVPAEDAFAYAYRKALDHVLATGTSTALLDEARAAVAGLPSA